MVKFGAISKTHIYGMLASKDVRVRRAAYALLEASNPKLRRNSELFMEVIRFIWDANPSYDIYLEFSERNLFHREFTKAPPPISAHQTRTRAGF